MENKGLFPERILKKEDKLRYVAGLFKTKHGALILTAKELYFISKDKKVLFIPLSNISSVNCERRAGRSGSMTVIYQEDSKEKRALISQTSLTYAVSWGNVSQAGPHYFASWEQAINQARHGPWYRGGEGIEDIKKLARLRDQGILTEEEFAAKKRQILNL